MTSGRKLTEQEADAILRLAAKTRDDGQWALTYQQIADRLGINEKTVRRWIRKSAVRFGQLTGWKSDEFA